MRILLPVLLLGCFLAPTARADEEDPRVAILRAELTRDAAALHPWLKPEAAPRLRRLALQALGRIGDDGTGPGMLRDLLATATPEGEPQLRRLLWAAGQAQTGELAAPLREALARLLAAEVWDLAGEAAHALGWCGVAEEAATLRPLVDHAEAAVRAGALEGLARLGASARADLLAASSRVHDEDPVVRAAADFACWLIAARHRAAASAEDEAWDGDPEVAARFLDHLVSPDPDRRMGAVRVLGSLLPEAVPPAGRFGAVHDLIGDPDPRVAQDVVWRVFARREHATATRALQRALHHGDEKVRRLAAEALQEREGDAVVAALERAWEAETDPRVREVLTVALAAHGKAAYWERLVQREDRPEDAVVRQRTAAQVLLVSPRAEALAELFVWADPGASQRAGHLHAATWMEILGGLAGREHPKLDEWLTGIFAGGYAVDRSQRHFVLAAAVDLVASDERLAHVDALLAMLERSHGEPPHDEVKESAVHEDVRAALMEAFGTLARAGDIDVAKAAAMEAAVQKHLRADPSPWVRRKARAAAQALGEEDVPAWDPHGAQNAWRGVPRFEPVDDTMPVPEGEATWLDEAQVLAVADWIEARDPRVVFETTAGTFEVRLDPVRAPVHAVSLLSAVQQGLYEDSRFHRVVPNFVIQGGDPFGHGAGGGGWTVPDEISRNRFVRGTLGMPKSTKDDGSTQIFVMHTAYRPLDGRYTAYGRVVRGMEVVDRIRVGDRILRARVEVAPR